MIAVFTSLDIISTYNTNEELTRSYISRPDGIRTSNQTLQAEFFRFRLFHFFFGFFPLSESPAPFAFDFLALRIVFRSFRDSFFVPLYFFGLGDRFPEWPASFSLEEAGAV